MFDPRADDYSNYKNTVKANLGKYFDGFFAPALLAVLAVVSGCIFYSLIEKPLTVFLRKNIVEKMFHPKAEGRI